MQNERIEKLINFLKQYRDIYGDDFYVNTANVSKILTDLTENSNETEEAKPIQQVASGSTKKPTPIQSKDTPLWNFNKQIRDCTKCPLGHTRTKFVFGVGNENADIIFIGEAPGREEDRLGLPFVGKAGKLLDKLLAHIKLKREDVYIANILKCRPPNNRDPEPNEVETCIPYLHRQIELIQPKLIVALGRVAAQNLLNTKDSLRNMRERLWQYQNVKMIVTYHPAAILRNTGMLNFAIEDFKKILETSQNDSSN